MVNALISILNWNGAIDSVKAVESLWQQVGVDYDLVVVDNNSDEPFVQEGVEIIHNSENLGFSGGHNILLQKAIDENYKYILLMNNDAVLRKNTLKTLVETLDSNPKAAAVSPKIVNQGGEVWFGGGVYSKATSKSRHLLTEDYISTTKVDFVSGCCLMIRVEALKRIGLLDDTFFLYFEDTDWSVRARHAGYELLYEPSAVAVHNVSSSLGASSPTYMYYNLRNHLLMVRKHVSLIYKPLAWMVWLKDVLIMYVRVMLFWRKDYFEYLKTPPLALWHHLRRRYGKL